MRKRKALITGGSGYLGRCLVEHFSALGFDVTATYFRNTPPQPGAASWRRWDMRLPISCAADKFDLVIHNASTLSCDAGEAAGADIASFFNLLPAARGAYFLYISSMDVFGPRQKGGLDENSPCEPESWYGFAKLSVENAALTAGRLGLLPACAALRLPYLLSAHPKHAAGFWGRLMRSAGERGGITVRDLARRELPRNGFSWADPEHVALSAAALFRARSSGIFHVSNGFVTWERVFTECAGLWGGKLRIKFDPRNPGGFALLRDERNLVADRLRKETGLKPEKNLSGLLAEMSGAWLPHVQAGPLRRRK